MHERGADVDDLGHEALGGSAESEAAAASESFDEADGSAQAERPGIDDGVLIPRGGSFEGQVVITGPTRIEGSVRGSLRGPGDLFIGSGARVEGRVECEALTSEGEIVGPVSALRCARFGAGARLDGDLQAPSVSFDESAIWNGRASVGGGLGAGPAAGLGAAGGVDPEA